MLHRVQRTLGIPETELIDFGLFDIVISASAYISTDN
jgi:hypothetical protein